MVFNFASLFWLLGASSLPKSIPRNIDGQLRVVNEALHDVERVRPRVVGGLGRRKRRRLRSVGDLQESGHGLAEEGAVAALQPVDNWSD